VYGFKRKFRHYRFEEFAFILKTVKTRDKHDFLVLVIPPIYYAHLISCPEQESDGIRRIIGYNPSYKYPIIP
jgi:hypothetical protein